MISTLDKSYARCREIHRAHGRSYYLATKLLPRWKHRHVHALYGLTRYADDLVDLIEVPSSDRAAVDTRQEASACNGERARQLSEYRRTFYAGIRDGAQAVAHHPILPAAAHTVATFDMDLRDFDAFFDRMAVDLTRSEYTTYDDLLGYMEGSAAAIGTMMLPILEPIALEDARMPARELGFAFQLTNFIRDVGEDLQRGRVYLPSEDMSRFGVTVEDLRAGVVTPSIRALLRFEIDRARQHYDRAEPGVAMLAPSSQRCIRTAFTLYREILEVIEKNGYDVFRQRARVPRQRKVAVVTYELLRPARNAGARQ